MARPKMTLPPVVSKEFTLNPAEIAANATAVQTVAVVGLRVGYPVLVWCPTLEVGLAISNAHCATADELKFTIANLTVAPINAADQAFEVVQF